MTRQIAKNPGAEDGKSGHHIWRNLPIYITAKFENNTLTIALEGSIDSVTAPEAEARITELRREYPKGEVVLDAEKLNYTRLSLKV